MRTRYKSAAIAVAAVAISLSFGQVAPAKAPTAPPKPGDLTSPNTCAPYALASVAKIAKSGAEIRTAMKPLADMQSEAQGDTQYGRAYRYTLDGVGVTSKVPPANWNPGTAPTVELRRYGLPPRPAGGSALKQWMKMYSRMHAVPVTGMCRTNQRGVSTANSTNWAGGISTGSFNQSEVHWIQPSYQAVCPSASRNSIWAGLGGWNGSKVLAQNGSEVEDGTVSNSHIWWEMLNGVYDTLQTRVSGLSIGPGQELGAATSYIKDDDHFDFTWYNFATENYAFVDEYSVGPQTAKQFYDGRTSDYISEATAKSSGGTLYQLRKPTADIKFTYAVANYTAISKFAGTQIDEVDPGGNKMQDSNYNGKNAWTVHWLRCS